MHCPILGFPYLEQTAAALFFEAAQQTASALILQRSDKLADEARESRVA